MYVGIYIDNKCTDCIYIIYSLVIHKYAMRIGIHIHAMRLGIHIHAMRLGIHKRLIHVCIHYIYFTYTEYTGIQ